MAAIDHRPTSVGRRREHPTNRHMTTVFILKSSASTYDALILIVSLAPARVPPSSRARELANLVRGETIHAMRTGSGGYLRKNIGSIRLSLLSALL